MATIKGSGSMWIIPPDTTPAYRVLAGGDKTLILTSEPITTIEFNEMAAQAAQSTLTLKELEKAMKQLGVKWGNTQ